MRIRDKKHTRLLLSTFIALSVNGCICSASANTAFGEGATTAGAGATAIGDSASAGNFGTATGSGANAGGQFGTATGRNASASGGFSTATGNGTEASGRSSTAVADTVRSAGIFSTAVGAGANATSNGALASGANSRAAGDYSTAVGTNSTARGKQSTALGSNSVSTGDNSTALGQGAQAAGTNSVALGSGSVAQRDNTVAVGGRQVTDVLDGTQDTDAVNVRQMKEGDAKTLVDARSYTDTSVTASEKRLNVSINNAKNEAITTSVNYTDTQIDNTKKVLNTNINNAKTEAITTSKNYTDGRYHQSITYAQGVADQAEHNANDYTDWKFSQLNRRDNELNNKIERAEKRLNAGIAGVTAIASIPYVAEDTFSWGVGLGNYENGNAMAAGVQYKTSLNTNVRLNLSLDSQHNMAAGVGFADGW
ncbi:YadA-like family protein [Klebsiella aerogenes]|uniref:YadA-like family protein n=1 Tax=Klebsiella aerogenes TaxID=548 RepID=A0AAP9R317_KLEAE|nr:YadA-like family protein [Klebsiella aerogenes]QMR42924.1 YadA-like family protein [Klebsiella aerogenes]